MVVNKAYTYSLSTESQILTRNVPESVRKILPATYVYVSAKRLPLARNTQVLFHVGTGADLVWHV